MPITRDVLIMLTLSDKQPRKGNGIKLLITHEPNIVIIRQQMLLLNKYLINDLTNEYGSSKLYSICNSIYQLIVSDSLKLLVWISTTT